MRPLLLLLLLLPLAPEAQTGTCAFADAEAYLENAGVRAVLRPDGILFWRNPGERIYEVPRGGGIHATSAVSFWLAGQSDGEVRFAGTEKVLPEYWPGPLAADGGPPSDESCEQYDRLWRVTLDDIARYNDTGEATADLLDWPHEVGAPVVDGDGDPTNYDLAAGDRPAIVGDETVWWIMNDRGGAHEWGYTDPIGVEVRVTAFSVSEAYARQRLRLSERVAALLHHATAYRYEITYRGDTPLDSAYAGFHSIQDLGRFDDNAVGSYPDGGLSFVYNADDVDEGQLGYGSSPPALGLRILDGPADRSLAGFMTYANSTDIDGIPQDGQQAYFYMTGRWRDGSPITYGGSGRGEGQPTPYMFPALPPAYWSEHDMDGQGFGPAGRFRRTVTSHGPFSMRPGDRDTLSVAFIYSRAESSALASVRKLIVEDAPLAGAYLKTIGPDPDLASLTPAQVPIPLPEPPEMPEAPERYAAAETVWPNPASGETALRLDLPDAADVRLTVYDALGREVATPQDGPLTGAEHRLPIQTTGWAPGVYVYRLAITPEAGGAPIETAGRFVVLTP